MPLSSRHLSGCGAGAPMKRQRLGVMGAALISVWMPDATSGGSLAVEDTSIPTCAAKPLGVAGAGAAAAMQAIRGLLSRYCNGGSKGYEPDQTFHPAKVERGSI